MTDDNASGTKDTATGTAPLDNATGTAPVNNASGTAQPDNPPPPPAPNPSDEGLSDEKLENTNNAEDAMHP
ncbi:hypothetical protein U1839_22335 [Sphingomonas sp. RT2P30]|uniref:hypothetical protein n=1 Tax=Parasphingomonas halimpatiens TaxID=3096162 RepID=UPI002FC8B283